MAKIWVLGNGQLGAMLKHAATPLGLEVEPVDIESSETLHLGTDDLVTAEREQWPETAITNALASHPNFVNLPVFAQLANRQTQKQLIDSLGLSTAPWCPVEADTTSEQLYQRLGERVLLKRKSGGYDGRGQLWLRQKNQDTLPNDWLETSIAEQAIGFDEELSLVGARDRSGQLFFYPLTLNLNTNGILRATVSPVARISHLQSVAEDMLGQLLNSLNYVGVMGMELFRLGDQIMINELAPRVHNTGHWTQSGASVSQFEYHMRAVAGLPMSPAWIKGPSVMINLIGTEFNPDWLAIPGAELYWYQKSVRPGRKLGHINFTAAGAEPIKTALDQLANTLPEDYQEPIRWAAQQLG